jgi:hypothetical protein
VELGWRWQALLGESLCKPGVKQLTELVQLPSARFGVHESFTVSHAQQVYVLMGLHSAYPLLHVTFPTRDVFVEKPSVMT